MPHRRDLDGLRAIAALLVLAFHFDVKPLWSGGWIGGWLGVGLFFGLSGYLITALLVRELERTGRIDVPAFWRRRFARVVPAAIVPAVFVLAAEWLYTGSLGSLGWLLPWSNLMMENGNLGHYWSIALELQFYLVIPLVLVLYRPSPWAFLVGAYALTFFFPPDVLGYGTLQRIAPFLIGATIARSGLPTTTLPIGWLAPIGADLVRALPVALPAVQPVRSDTGGAPRRLHRGLGELPLHRETVHPLGSEAPFGRPGRRRSTGRCSAAAGRLTFGGAPIWCQLPR